MIRVVVVVYEELRFTFFKRVWMARSTKSGYRTITTQDNGQTQEEKRRGEEGQAEARGTCSFTKYCSGSKSCSSQPASPTPTHTVYYYPSAQPACVLGRSLTISTHGEELGGLARSIRPKRQEGYSVHTVKKDGRCKMERARAKKQRSTESAKASLFKQKWGLCFGSTGVMETRFAVVWPGDGDMWKRSLLGRGDMETWEEKLGLGFYLDVCDGNEEKQRRRGDAEYCPRIWFLLV